MPYSIQYDDADFVFVVFEGDLDAAAAKMLVRELVSFANKHKCFRILADYRKAALKLSVGFIYELPNLIVREAAITGASVDQMKRALVVPQKFYEGFRFFETVSLNRSQKIRIFEDIDEARSWLLTP